MQPVYTHLRPSPSHLRCPSPPYASAAATHYTTTSSDSPISPQLPDIPNDETLAHISVRELNHMLQGHNREFVTQMKQKRRTLKNRHYALNCRVRRIQTQLQLEADNVVLKEKLRQMHSFLIDMASRLQYFDPSFVMPEISMPHFSYSPQTTPSCSSSSQITSVPLAPLPLQPHNLNIMQQGHSY